MLDSVVWLLAQTSQPGGGAAPTPAPGSGTGAGGSGWLQMLPFFAAILVLYWFLIRGQRKQQSKVEQMRAGLKRNDRVQTVGGIIGTVVDVRENEVIVKVDETNNVKMRFVRSAIGSVLDAEAPAK